MKIIVLIFIFLILASLVSALYFMIKNKGGASTRTARALTWRVVFSISLFTLLRLAYHFGLISTRL